MTLLKRNLVNLLIAGILYFNLAALLAACGIRFPDWPGTSGPLPNHWVTRKLFRMFGVFGGISHYNLSYSAWGTTRRLEDSPAEPLPTMIDLHLEDVFRHSRGEANQRLAMRPYAGDARRSEQAYRRLAETLQARHNAQPGRPKVVQVFIYKSWWPKSPLGYSQLADRKETVLAGHN